MANMNRRRKRLVRLIAEYREHIRREATAAARELVAALREADPELHGAGKG